MECPHPHIQVPPLVAQPLEASPCIQRMAPPHVPNIAVEPFEEVGDDKEIEAKVFSYCLPRSRMKKNIKWCYKRYLCSQGMKLE